MNHDPGQATTVYPHTLAVRMSTRIVYDFDSSGSDEFDEETLIVECETEENDGGDILNINDRNNEGNFDEIQPYMYEPECSDSEGEDEDGDRDQLVHDANPVDIQLRTQLLNWCQCGQCELLPTYRECRCCQEITAMEQRLEEGETMYNRDAYKCITEHPGFVAACLNVHVLEIAWLQYRQQYDAAFEGPKHKRLRHAAYRQLARWCWGFLGRNLRVVLPSCAVSSIRAHFPPPGLEDDFQFAGYLN